MLKRVGDLGIPLEVVYGGSHGSQPLVSRYGVRAGDILYTVSVEKGDLLIVGGMCVTGILPWLEHAEHHLGMPNASTTAEPWRVAPHLARQHPEWGSSAPVGMRGGSCDR